MRIIEIAVDQSLTYCVCLLFHTNCFVLQVVEKAINVLKKTAGEDFRIVISLGVRERVQEKKPICCCKEGAGGTFNLVS